MERLKVAIIIPAYNEEKTIQSVIYPLKKLARLFVVNDCSTDNTLKILKKNKNIIIINNKNNIGYEASLNKGFEKAYKMGFNYFITYDADNQFYHKDVIKIINFFERGFDLILCNRNKFQRYSEYLFFIISKMRYNIDDPLCGLKGYSKNVYKSLGYFDKFNSSGTQLMFHAIKNKYKTKKIKIRTKKRKDNSRFGSGIKAEFHIFRSIIIFLIFNIL